MHTILYEHRGPTQIYIEASVTDDGDLRVAGHDLGEAPKKYFGNRNGFRGREGCASHEMFTQHLQLSGKRGVLRRCLIDSGPQSVAC